ncbi:MAG: IS3 family transposase [Subdoligranulum sp.]
MYFSWHIADYIDYYNSSRIQAKATPHNSRLTA